MSEDTLQVNGYDQNRSRTRFPAELASLRERLRLIIECLIRLALSPWDGYEG
jgi:hypothetical protein